MEPTFGSLTFMFPMWNEEEMIHRTVDAARETASDLLATGQIGEYEILIVDDASTDKTAAIAGMLQIKIDALKVEHAASADDGRHFGSPKSRTASSNDAARALGVLGVERH